jgi:hypothetical protein
MNPTPWRDWLLNHIGEPCKTGYEPTEFNILCFKHTDYGSIGHVLPPSCAATLCAALEINGFKSPHDASAISFAKYGRPSEMLQGAILVLQHVTGPLRGHYHVTTLDHQSGDLAYCLGGNQGHLLQVSPYNLKVDYQVVACRWPTK